ncbi:MAG: hypothetical protein NTW50_03995 [Candidatus Berkelbacteria bacterium]|nr:hypothetical protein [Candidatus Berkelbacteria bacterium]
MCYYCEEEDHGCTLARAFSRPNPKRDAALYSEQQKAVSFEAYLNALILEHTSVDNDVWGQLKGLQRNAKTPAQKLAIASAMGICGRHHFGDIDRLAKRAKNPRVKSAYQRARMVSYDQYISLDED